MALWTIALLSILVVSFTFDAHLETKVLSVTRKRHQAEYLAMSGITIAEMLMDKQGRVSGDASPEAIADDRWFQPALLLQRGLTVQLVEKLGEGYIRLDIEPEPGRRNVNRLTDEDWERVLEVGGVPRELWPTLIDAFNDWKDADNLPRQDGAETEDHYETLTPPYRARNGDIDTVRELLLVKGFREAILSGGVLNPEDPPDRHRRLSGIQDMLTTYGDGKVNVNAANERVLMTLPNVDRDVAGAIVEERGKSRSDGANGIPKTGFDTQAELMAHIPLLTPEALAHMEFRSKTFRVTSVGQVGRMTRRIWAILKLNDNKKLTILQWREET